MVLRFPPVKLQSELSSQLRRLCCRWHWHQLRTGQGLGPSVYKTQGPYPEWKYSLSLFHPPSTSAVKVWIFSSEKCVWTCVYKCWCTRHCFCYVRAVNIWDHCVSVVEVGGGGSTYCSPILIRMEQFPCSWIILS